MMRVTLVISSLGVGGAERVMSIMSNYWAQKGWPVTLVTLDKRQPFYDLHPGIVFKPLGIAGDSANVLHGMLNNLRRLLVLRDAILQASSHVTISFVDRTNVLTLLATLGLQQPVVISERIYPCASPLGKAWQLARRWSYPRAARLVVQSTATLECFSPKLRKRTRVIPNPVHVPFNESIPGRSPLGGERPKRLLAMGRLTEQKGFDQLLKAFAALAQQHPDWVLEIWGQGPLHAELQTLIEHLKLAGRTRLAGVTPEPFAQMRRADLFVLSSRYEGFPNVLCEAMACGLPVISFDCPTGPREIIRDGVDGVLVPNGNLEALIAAMERLMSDEGERWRFSAQAPDIRSRFGLEKVMQMWEELLEEIVLPSRPRQRWFERSS